MGNPLLGELRTFGFNFTPVGWLACNGALQSIADNSALFSLLGTTYGGDGVTTFAVPDLRSRIPIHFGQGPGQPNYSLGQMAGAPTVQLGVGNMPAHTHTITGTASQPAAAGVGTTSAPGGSIPAGSTTGENYAPPAASTGALAPMQITGSLQPTGGGQAFENLPPYLTLNFCIASEGIYPSRN